MQDGVDGFVLRDPLDAKTLGQLVEKLRADPDLRRKVGEAAAKTALAWDWSSNAAAVWELLEKARAFQPQK